MATMNSLRSAAPAASALLVLLLGGACATPNLTVDLARNDQLYTDVPFVTKAPGDRAVFLAPIADERKAGELPTQERGFPIVYGGDEVWERPVEAMVGDVLERQVRGSGLFTAVVATAAPEALVVKPTIVSFLAGAAESMAGTRSFAEVGLRLEVFGPSDAAGVRPLLLDTIFASRQASEPTLNPISPYRLVGRALQVSIGKALTGLDGSSVGRSQVPLSVAVPASASPGK